MNANLALFETPQAAYDWAREQFSAGGFQITGHQSAFRNWYVVSNGGFTFLHLSKVGAAR